MTVSRSLLVPAAFAAFAVAHAQDATRLTNTADSANRIAGLAEKKPASDDAGATVSLDELEDTGETRLLAGKPPHNWFLAAADVQAYWTDNAALSSGNRTTSDVSVLTAQAAVRAPEFAVGSGRALVSAGYRYQDFYYGALSGRENHALPVTGTKLDQLDFRTHTGFVRADWNTTSGWFAGTEGRFTAYVSSDTDKTTYQEWAPSVFAGKVVAFSERDFLTLSGDAGYRFSHTMFTLGVVGADLNDRYDLGANIAYAHVFGEHWVVQPSYRFQFSGFTEGEGTTNRNRMDITQSVSLTVAYVIDRHFSVRVFGSFENRDAMNSPDDYRSGVAGLGAMATATF